MLRNPMYWANERQVQPSVDTMISHADVIILPVAVNPSVVCKQDGNTPFPETWLPTHYISGLCWSQMVTRCWLENADFAETFKQNIDTIDNTQTRHQTNMNLLLYLYILWIIHADILTGNLTAYSFCFCFFFWEIRLGVQLCDRALTLKFWEIFAKKSFQVLLKRNVSIKPLPLRFRDRSGPGGRKIVRVRDGNRKQHLLDTTELTHTYEHTETDSTYRILNKLKPGKVSSLRRENGHKASP